MKFNTVAMIHSNVYGDIMGVRECAWFSQELCRLHKHIRLDAQPRRRSSPLIHHEQSVVAQNFHEAIYTLVVSERKKILAQDGRIQICHSNREGVLNFLRL